MRDAARSAIIGVVALLAACASPTPFQPAEHDGSNGYSVERQAQDHFHIRFAGNSSTSAQQVEANLAYLAAQVTLRNGADYFVISDGKPQRTTTHDFLNSYSRDPFIRCCHWRGVTSHEYEADADIVIFRGNAPPDRADAHDARAVVEQVLPLIKRGSRYSVY
jgi:hypothetical protein